MKLGLMIAGVLSSGTVLHAAPLKHPIYEAGWENVAYTGDVSAATLQGGIGAADIRYDPKGDYPFVPPEKGIDLTAWRGERVNAQVVVWAGVPLSQLSLALSPLRTP